MGDAFQSGAFQHPGFQMGGPGFSLGSVNDSRIPRWLLKLERIGRTTYLSDVGGDVEGIFYIPAVVSVEHSDLSIDLERMNMPVPSASVTISPSALREHFIEPKELGQAKVTIRAWDGRRSYPVIQADMMQPMYGYDGEPTTFRLQEDFRHNPTFPERLVNFDGFDRAALVDGARFRTFQQVWGDAGKVPAFALLVDGGDTRWMLAGHNVATLPTGGSGSPGRCRDLLGTIYICAEFSSPPEDPYYDFSDAQGFVTAADLVHDLLERRSGYTVDEIDYESLERLYAHLSGFAVGGYVDQEGPLFSLFANRFQREFMFVLVELSGRLRGYPINPAAKPSRVLVFGVHLLELADKTTDDLRYSRFKVRYRYQPTPDPGWYGVRDVGAPDDPILKQNQDLWGFRDFGDPVEWKRHADSVDLPDVVDDGTAEKILRRYEHMFHRGERAQYLQLAEFSTIPFGTVVSLVDPGRGFDLKRAMLYGRRWLTPELVVNKYRTIEPLKLPAAVEATPPDVECADLNGNFEVPPGAFYDPTGGPGGEPIIRAPDNVTITLEQYCGCGLTAPTTGYFRYGAKIFACLLDNPSPTWGFRARLKVWSDPQCLFTAGSANFSATNDGIAGGPDPQGVILDRYEHAGVFAAGSHATLEIDLVLEHATETPQGYIALMDFYLEFFASEPGDLNDSTPTGDCVL